MTARCRRRRPARRRVDGAVRRALPQGGHRRPRRRPAAHARGAARLPPRARGAARGRARLRSRSRASSTDEAPRADPRRRDQGAPRGHLPALQAEAPHQGPDRPGGRPRAARRPAARLDPAPTPPLPRRPSSTTTRRSPTLPPRSTAPAPSSSSASPRTPTSSVTCASASGSRGTSARASAPARRTEGAKFSDYFDFSEPLPEAARPTASSPSSAARRRSPLADDRPRAADRRGSNPARRHTSGPSRAASASRTTGRPADEWLADTVRWAWRTKILVHLGIDVRMQLRQRRRGGGRARVRRQPARPAARRTRRRARRRWASTRASAPASRSPSSTRPASVVATDVIYPHVPQRQWDRSLATLARLCARSTRSTSSPSATAPPRARPTVWPPTSSSAHPELKLTSAVVSEAGRLRLLRLGVRLRRSCPGMDVSLRGAVSIARRLQDPLAELVKIDPKSIGVGQYQHDLSQTALVALPRRGRRGLRQRRRRRRQHRLRSPADAASRASRPSLADSIVAHRDANGPFRKRARPSRTSRASAPRPSSRRPASSGSPAGTTRSTPPPCTPRPTRSSAGSSSRDRAASCTQLIGNTAALQAIRPADVRRRHVRPAHGHRHPQRARQARARPAADVQDGHLQGGRRGDQAPQAGHDARGRRDQRRRLRRLHRHRRPPGRPRPRVGAVAPLRPRPATRSSSRATSSGQGARRRPPAQADLAHAAPRRRGDAGRRPERQA